MRISSSPLAMRSGGRNGSFATRSNACRARSRRRPCNQPARSCGCLTITDFSRSADGLEIYFHRNSVLNGGFAKLEPGMKVSFVEEQGEKGPQASTVKLLGKHTAALTATAALQHAF